MWCDTHPYNKPCNIEATNKITNSIHVNLLATLWCCMEKMFVLFVCCFFFFISFSVNIPKLLHKNCYSKIFVQIRVTKFHWIIFSVTNIVIAKKLMWFFVWKYLEYKNIVICARYKGGRSQCRWKVFVYLSLFFSLFFCFVIYVYNKYLCIHILYTYINIFER